MGGGQREFKLWFEDTPVSFILAGIPYRCASIKDIVYGYRQNPEGITATASHSKKSVDSYWITEECLEEFPKYDLSYDQRAYEYLLRQSIMNTGRMRLLSGKIQEAQFILTAELMERYFKGFSTKNTKLKNIENALRKRRFVQFKLLLFGL